MGEDLHLHRDIDVLFLGEIAYGRRKPILDNIRARLSEKGIDLTVNSGNCYGRERSELLSRAKISLNLPRFTWDLPTIRLFMSMGCGSMVASEYVADTTPFVSGEHFVQATADKIADKIAYYLNHDAEREAISARATKLITTDYTLEKALQRVLALYEKS
jgi:glycosyltransferase involved in cell wall biosynthesis